MASDVATSFEGWEALLSLKGGIFCRNCMTSMGQRVSLSYFLPIGSKEQGGGSLIRGATWGRNFKKDNGNFLGLGRKGCHGHQGIRPLNAPGTLLRLNSKNRTAIQTEKDQYLALGDLGVERENEKKRPGPVEIGTKKGGGQLRGSPLIKKAG